ncbi:MAG: hypothetical protein B6242_06265 [Anaerolineaceae bacterium 4572_78]|nr:MAG: hypothetical protein B6242_06265 [Anaerolineaceae bacterium 4572_78]
MVTATSQKITIIQIEHVFDYEKEILIKVDDVITKGQLIASLDTWRLYNPPDTKKARQLPRSNIILSTSTCTSTSTPTKISTWTSTSTQTPTPVPTNIPKQDTTYIFSPVSGKVVDIIILNIVGNEIIVQVTVGDTNEF